MYGSIYLTRELPGTGGELKSIPEDFVVHEIALYPASGQGEHVYVEIEKKGLTTFEAIERIGRALRVPDHTIGYAGLKDSRAVTRQVISIHNADPAEVERLTLPRISILRVDRHTNKLRTGHLRGNRFRITLREVEEGALARARAVLAVLTERGVPNAFGLQRFGSRRDAHRIGRFLLLDDAKAAVDSIIGHPSRFERNPAVIEARHRYDAGDLEEALARFPASYRNERTLIRGLLESGGRHSEAVRLIPKKLHRLYLAAFQSHLFNMTLCRRLGAFDRLMPGDLAYKHHNGAVFAVSDTMDFEELDDRRRRFDISPSGPLHGYKMPQPVGQPRLLEDEVLRDEGFDPARLPQALRGARMKGERRSLRVPLREVALEPGEEEGSLVVSFVLPRGSYATVVMREIMKAGDDELVLETSEDRNRS